MHGVTGKPPGADISPATSRFTLLLLVAMTGVAPISLYISPRHQLEKLIWFGLALQFAGALLNLAWGVSGLNQAPSWLFGTQMLVMFANAFVMSNSAAGAISVRPEAAGTASGAMGFLQMGLG